jgi:hypothetical protein
MGDEAAKPEDEPAGTVPANDGLWFDEQDHLPKATEPPGQSVDQPSVEAADSGALQTGPRDDELLAEE